MERDYSPREVIAIVRRRRWAVLASLFLGLGLASTVSIVLPKTYKSRTKIEVTANKNIPGSESAAKVDAVREQLLSLSTMSGVVEKLGLDAVKDDRAARMSPEERRLAVAKDLINATRVEKEQPSEGTYYIVVEHVSSDAIVCHQVLDCLVSGYKKDLYERPRLQQQDVVAAAAASVDAATIRMNEAQAELTAFEEENRSLLGPLDEQLAEVRRQLSEREQKEVTLHEEQLRVAEEYLKAEPQFHTQKVKRVDSVRMVGYDTELNRLKIRLNELIETKRFTDEHPEVVSVRKSIRQLEAEKKVLEDSAPVEEVRTENALYIEYMKQKSQAQANLKVAREGLAKLRVEERELQERVKQVPPVKNQHDRLTANVAGAGKSLDDRKSDFTKAQDKLRTIEGERQLEFTIVDPPMAPRGPAGPAPALFALGGLAVGLAAGLGLAWVVDVQDRSFREVDAVAEFLGVPSLGAIHQIETSAEISARRRSTFRKAAAVALLGFAAAGLAGWSVWVGLRHNPVEHVKEDGSR